MAKVVVTGGAGFIGSHLAEALSAEHEVRVVDSLITGRAENLDGIDVEFVEQSIIDTDGLTKAFDGAAAVFHQAAIPRVPRSVDFPIESHENNATGTISVLEAARAAGVERVVYASSSSLYGREPTLPKTESMAVNPASPYAASKLAGEAYCRCYTESYGLVTVSLRYFNVFGPRQDPVSKYGAALPNFASRLLSGQRPLVYGDGEQTRDFTFVRDVVAANIASWLAPAAQVAGRAFNVGCGTRHSINRLIEVLKVQTGAAGITAEYTGDRPGDVRDTQADIRALTAATGWTPKVGLEEGCQALVDWLRANPERMVAFAG